MKNLKNTVAAAALMAVLGMGTVSANAGLLISDRSSGCGSVKSGGLLNQLAGIVIGGAPLLDGIIIVGRDGLMVSDKAAPCGGETSKDGIIIVGRDGLMVSD